MHADSLSYDIVSHISTIKTVKLMLNRGWIDCYLFGFGRKGKRKIKLAYNSAYSIDNQLWAYICWDSYLDLNTHKL